MESKFINEMNTDYKDFMRSFDGQPSPEIRSHIFSMVREDLNPNSWKIFAKISFIHFLVGTLTLTLCPQFGVRLFGDGTGLMRFFASVGAYGCMALCGAFFVGMSFLTAAFFLTRDELRVLKRYRWLQIAAITLLSLGLFVMADANILVGFAIAWILGSVFGGVAMLELGALLRHRRFLNV